MTNTYQHMEWDEQERIWNAALEQPKEAWTVLAKIASVHEGWTQIERVGDHIFSIVYGVSGQSSTMLPWLAEDGVRHATHQGYAEALRMAAEDTLALISDGDDEPLDPDGVMGYEDRGEYILDALTDLQKDGAAVVTFSKMDGFLPHITDSYVMDDNDHESNAACIDGIWDRLRNGGWID